MELEAGIYMLLLVPVLAYGQSKPCCFPDKWEADAEVMTGSVDDEGNPALVLVHSRISIDAIARRVHVTERVEQPTSGEPAEEYTVLSLFDKGVEYIIHNGTCTTATLEPWNNRNCLPGNATVTGAYTYGVHQRVPVTEYSWVEGNTTNSMGVTNDCIPMIKVQQGSINGESVMIGVGVQGATEGIADPTIFVKPDICNSAQNATTRHRRHLHKRLRIII